MILVRVGGCAVVGFGPIGFAVASQGDDVGAEARIGRQHAVVAVAVNPGRRDQAGEGVEKLEG